MAKAFDLSKPKDAAHIERSLRMLLNRERDHLEALHYLKTADGSYCCLDLSLSAESETALDEACIQWVRSNGGPQILPAAPRAMWMRMAEAEFSHQRIISMPEIRGHLVVSLCEER